MSQLNFSWVIDGKLAGWWQNQDNEWIGFHYDLSKDFTRFPAEKQVTLICHFVQNVLESTREAKKPS